MWTMGWVRRGRQIGDGDTELLLKVPSEWNREGNINAKVRHKASKTRVRNLLFMFILLWFLVSILYTTVELIAEAFPSHFHPRRLGGGGGKKST